MIYKDCLGRPNSEACISFVNNSFSPDESYYSLSSVSDCPSRRWKKDMPIDTIVQEMTSDGWKCDVSKDGYGRARIDCIHAETQKVIDARKKAIDDKFIGAERGYIRFGSVPTSGQSINYRDNTPEIGVSCFEADFAADGSYRLHLTPILEVSWLTVMDRTAYRLYGDVVGTGSDGEPLLRVDKAVKI